MAFFRDRKIGFREYFKYLLEIQNPKYIFKKQDYLIKESKKTHRIDLFARVTTLLIFFMFLEINNFFNIHSELTKDIILVISIILAYFISELLHWFYAEFDSFEKIEK